MTTHDYFMTMKAKSERTVGIAELKARLSAHLRAVRRGHPVTVCDRDTPVARLVPYATDGEQLSTRLPLRSLHDVSLPAPLGRRIDSLAALLEARQSTR